MKAKRVLALLICAMMLLSLAGCAKDTYKNAVELMEKGSYEEALEQFRTIPDYEDIPDYRYAVNLDKNEYVKIPKFKEGVWTLHPLSLLCADGNQRGGGDYEGTDMEYIGRWAFDRIGVQMKKPDTDFKEIKPKFKLDY